MQGKRQARSTKVLDGRRGGPTGGLLGRLAGAAAGWRRSRRGTVLVLIVSALALLSVVVVAYVAIGRGDKRAGEQTARVSGIEENIRRIADYIAVDVVGRDALAVYVDGEEPWNASPGTGVPIVMREATDYPSIDDQRRSRVTGGSSVDLTRRRFDPAGTLPGTWTTSDGIKPFPPTDPFLAPLAPTWLNPPQGGAVRDRIANERDWGTISTIAPDGRFVNLGNLRGNFDAEHGLGQDNQNRNRVSEGLTLLDPSGRSYAPGSSQLDYGGAADPNIPAHWGTRQRGAFRPAVDVLYPPSDPRHAFNQWCDADGDGMFDSRWAELVDATLPDEITSVLPRDGRFRWFVAARIVDLSGLANVNVATDMREKPEDDYRAGVTPADVDLRRILTLHDAYREFSLYNDLGLEGYSALAQPSGTGPENYGRMGYGEHASAGANGYASLGRALDGVLVPSLTINMSMDPAPDAEFRYRSYLEATSFFPGEPGRDSQSGSVITLSGPMGLDDLQELLTYRGINDDATLSRLEQVIGGRDQSNPSYSPLRDNRSLSVERRHEYDQVGQAAATTLAWSTLDVRQLLTTISGSRPIRSTRLMVDPTDGFDLADAIATMEWRKEPTSGSLPEGRERHRETRYCAPKLLEQATVYIQDPSSQQGQIEQRDKQLAVSSIFAAYCDALLPHSAEPGAWAPQSSPEMSTLHYGGDAQFALRTAAHMAANLRDLADGRERRWVNNAWVLGERDRVSGYTLLLDGSFRQSLAGMSGEFPYWNRTLPTGGVDTSGRMDLDDALGLVDPATNQVYPFTVSRLGDTSAYPGLPRALNIFGVEAQPFITEAATFFIYTDTPKDSGGDEEWTEDNEPGPGGGGTVVIPGIVTINGTFPISQAGNGANPDFITQVVAFQLSNPFDDDIVLDEPSGSGSQFLIEFGGQSYALTGTLAKRSSTVFYATTFTTAEIDQRLRNADSSIMTGAFQTWLGAQVRGSSVSAVEVQPTAPLGGQIGHRLLAGSPGDNDPQNREVRLYRKIGTNSRALLADRLRDPADSSASPRPTLDRRLPHSHEQVVGTVAGKEGTAGALDNTGYSITMWAKIRRPDDPAYSTAQGVYPEAPIGALPAWCIERKHVSTTSPSLNVDGKVSVSPTSLNKTDFTGGASNPPGETTLSGLLSDQNGPNEELVRTLVREPKEKRSIEDKKVPTTEQVQGLEFDEIYAEVHLDNFRFRRDRDNDPQNNTLFSVMRPGDVLLPLGVGPVQDPMNPSDEWTTFGESMAQALGYDDLPTTGAPMANLYEKLDRGGIMHDGPAPYIDASRNGAFDAGEPRRGSGVPFAMNILDIFTTDAPEIASLTRATPGKVNLNTAPIQVLRALPMLSPPENADALGDPLWWWKTGTGVPTVPHDGRSDIAATLFAYREKSRRVPIGETGDMSFVGATGVAGLFSDDTGRYDPASTATSPTDIEAIREYPGLGSLGEILAVRNENYTASTQAAYPRAMDIERLGEDDLSTNAEDRGVDSIQYGLDVNSLGTPDDDQIIDDHDETFAIANAVAASATTRSDYFAAWFVVHGYQRSDTENLGPNDPMTPTVARRYLMILDRSNVTRAGDRPRILLLKELPL